MGGADDTEKITQLYRFREQKSIDLGLIPAYKEQRPVDPTTVNSVLIAEKWRKSVVREITVKITQVVDGLFF